MKMIHLFFAASRLSRVIFRTCFGRWIEYWQGTRLLNGMIEVNEGTNPPVTNLEHDLMSLLSRLKYVHSLDESCVAMFHTCGSWRLAVKTDPA